MPICTSRLYYRGHLLHSEPRLFLPVPLDFYIEIFTGIQKTRLPYLPTCIVGITSAPYRINRYPFTILSWHAKLASTLHLHCDCDDYWSFTARHLPNLQLRSQFRYRSRSLGWWPKIYFGSVLCWAIVAELHWPRNTRLSRTPRIESESIVLNILKSATWYNTLSSGKFHPWARDIRFRVCIAANTWLLKMGYPIWPLSWQIPILSVGHWHLSMHMEVYGGQIPHFVQ